MTTFFQSDSSPSDVLAAVRLLAQSLVPASGNGPPAKTLGLDGTFYVDRQDPLAPVLYGPKTNGAWGAGVPLVGPAGTNGFRISLSALKAAPISERASIYNNGLWIWMLGDYSGQADDLSVVKSDSTALTIGAWVNPLLRPTGFLQIRHKRGEQGTYARTALQLSKIGGFDGNNGTISAHHWIDPDLDDNIVKRENGVPVHGMIQRALDYAPIGCTLGFLNGDYRTTDTIVQRRYMHLAGSYTTRIQGVFSDNLRNLFEVKLQNGPYGLGGDARSLSYVGIDWYMAVGGLGAFLLDTSTNGLVPNLFAEFMRCGFDGPGTGDGYAARIRGLTTQGHKFTLSEFNNTLFLDGCADGVNVDQCRMGGAKVGVITDIAPGAFQTNFTRNLIVCRDGSFWIRNGSQMHFENNQMEQIGVNQSATRAHVRIAPESYVAKCIRFLMNNFGAGSNLDYSIVAQGIGINLLDGMEIDRNVFNTTATGIDIVLNNAEVQWTRIGPSNELRGNRGGATVDANGYASPNSLDTKTLLVVTDNAVGTYGLWKAAALNSAWTSNGGRTPKFYKSYDDTLLISGVVGGGAVGDTLFNLADGYRTPIQTTRVVACGGGFAVLRMEANGDVIVQSSQGGPIDIGMCIPVSGRASYAPSV